MLAQALQLDPLGRRGNDGSSKRSQNAPSVATRTRDDDERIGRNEHVGSTSRNDLGGGHSTCTRTACVVHTRGVQVSSQGHVLATGHHPGQRWPLVALQKQDDNISDTGLE